MIQKKSQLIPRELLITNRSGFSVVEVVVASAAFALLVTSLVGAILYFNKAVKRAGATTKAVFLVEEGLEATRNIRDENFSNLIDGTYGLSKAGGEWNFSGSSDITDIFTRQVEISTVDVNTKLIDSEVTWNQGQMPPGSVSLSTYLTYWQEEVIVTTSTDSCSAHCQSNSYDDGTCRANQAACGVNGQIHESGGNQYCTVDPAENVCCCTPPPVVVTTCSDYCANNGYSAGTCRQNVNQCSRNSETSESGGDSYCTGGANADTCCCN